MRSAAPARAEQQIDAADFGFGIIDRWAPTQIPRGAALYSYDADYDARNIGNRRGYASVLENGPGAVKVADFESAEAWTGGTVDTTNFVLVEALADGTRGRQLSVAAAGSLTSELTFAAQDLGSGQLDVFHLWVKAVALPASITGYRLRLRFETSGGNHYEVVAATHSDPPNVLEAGRDKYHRFRRQQFAATGAPSWASVAKISLLLDNVTGSGTLTITVDNLHRTPGLMQDLFQFRRQSGSFAKASDEYAAAGGSLYRNDGKRWTQVFSGFDAEMPVHSITTKDRRLMTDGKTTPRVMLADGLTVYRLGIVAPPRTITAAEIAGGQLSSGTQLFVRVLYYSSKTDTFSAPDDREAATALITISANDKGVRFSNIPVSSDPQVDHVVIGIRPDLEPEVFYRATNGALGDVANGVTTLDFLDSVTTLRSRVDDTVDPDMDYPSFIDPLTKQPAEAHPLFFTEAGGYVLTAMAEQPTVARWSRFRYPGSWALEDEQPLGENDSDPLTGFASIMSNVFAFKRTRVYPARVVSGDEGIRFENDISERGAVDHKSIIKVGHSLHYRGQDGIYVLDVGQVPRLATALAQGTWDGTWSPNADGWGCAVVNRNRHQVVHFSRRLGSPRNDAGWVTHYRTVRVVGPAVRGRWPEWAPTVHRLPADVAAEVKAQAEGWVPWVGGMGQVWWLNRGYEDDGRPIETVHRTGLWSNDPRMVHVFKDMQFEGGCAGDFDLEVKAFIGTAISQDGATLKGDLRGNADVLGSFVLGTDILGAPKYVSDRLKLPPKVGRYVSFELRFYGRGALEVYRMNVASTPIGRLRPRM